MTNQVAAVLKKSHCFDPFATAANENWTKSIEAEFARVEKELRKLHPATILKDVMESEAQVSSRFSENSALYRGCVVEGIKTTLKTIAKEKGQTAESWRSVAIAVYSLQNADACPILHMPGPRKPAELKLVKR